MINTIISKSVARDIHRVRRALEAIDAIENGQGKRYFATRTRREQWPNIAHLECNGTTIAIRSDILSKWVSAATEHPNRDAYYGKDEGVRLSYDDKGTVQLRQGTTSVKLFPINLGEFPPIYPIPCNVNGTIELAIDAKAIIEKARALQKSKRVADTK